MSSKNDMERARWTEKTERLTYFGRCLPLSNEERLNRETEIGELLAYRYNSGRNNVYQTGRQYLIKCTN